MRRPVISTFVAGIPELVRSGVNGWLVPAGDVDALADAIISCLDTSFEQLEEMGNAGRAAVLANYNVEKEAAKLGQILCETTVKNSPHLQTRE